jgi:hypothetical protein
MEFHRGLGKVAQPCRRLEDLEAVDGEGAKVL